MTQAILAHLFSYNMTWGATRKEVEISNFFKEVPKIMKRYVTSLAFRMTRISTQTRFWFSTLVSVVIIGGMIVCATPFVPLGWRVDGTAWAVILPLAYGIVMSCGRRMANSFHLVSSLAVTSCFL
jgi:hypothetical protein